MGKDRNLILEYINKSIEDEQNSFDWYGIKFAALLMDKKYEELIDCIDDVLEKHELCKGTLLELRMEIMQKIKARIDV